MGEDAPSEVGGMGHYLLNVVFFERGGRKVSTGPNPLGSVFRAGHFSETSKSLQRQSAFPLFGGWVVPVWSSTNLPGMQGCGAGRCLSRNCIWLVAILCPNS